VERLPVSSHHLPDPELVDDADLAAQHLEALRERDRQAKIAEIALLHLQQTRKEVCRLGDVLEHQRRRRPGLGMAAVLVLALAAFGGGFELGMSHSSDGPAAAGELACVTRLEPPHSHPGSWSR
jgi:hypothetical protein